MDTLFSQHRLSGTRLARLIIAPPDQQASLLWEWYPANDNRQPEIYFDYYGRTRSRVRRFHRRDCSEEDLRAEAESWRLQGLEPEKRVFRDNGRAVVQYLDAHHSRELVMLAQQRLEAYASGLRVTAQPHICALDGPDPCWIWLDCAEVLDVELADAKANVTLTIASRMGLPNATRVAIVHAASRRVISHWTMPTGFDVMAAATCERVSATWAGFERLHASIPVN